MDENGVQVDDTTTETHQEVTEQQVDDVKQEQAEEAVDETGVPLKNREAEAIRKARKAERMTQAQAESALLSGNVREDAGGSQEDAIAIVAAIADQQAKKAMEPLLAKQFLLEYPEARDMVTEINEIRNKYPELRDVDKLPLALKIAQAERQDEIIRQQVEARTTENQAKLEKSNNASLEGTGSAKKVDGNKTAVEQIASANSIEELERLEGLVR